MISRSPAPKPRRRSAATIASVRRSSSAQDQRRSPWITPGWFGRRRAVWVSSDPKFMTLCAMILPPRGLEVVGLAGRPEIAPQPAATINRQHLAGDELAGGAGEIDAGLGHVEGVAHMQHRVGAAEALARLLGVDIHAVGLDRAGRHAIDADAERRPFDRDGPAERDHTGAG